MSDLHIHIERLIIEGVALDARELRLMQAAVESELARQLTSEEASTLRSNNSSDHRAAEPIQWNPVKGPVSLGQQVGMAVSRSIQ